MVPTRGNLSTTLVQDILQAFDDLDGVHPGFRPAHAEGILLSDPLIGSRADFYLLSGRQRRANGARQEA